MINQRRRKMSTITLIFSVIAKGQEYLEDWEMEEVTAAIAEVIPIKVELIDIDYTQDNTFEVTLESNNNKQSSIDNIIKTIIDDIKKKEIKGAKRTITLKYVSMKDVTKLYEMRFRLVDKDGTPLSNITTKEEGKIDLEISNLIGYINDKFNSIVYGHKIEGNKVIFSFNTTEKIYNQENETLGDIILDSFNSERITGINDREIIILPIKEIKKLPNPKSKVKPKTPKKEKKSILPTKKAELLLSFIYKKDGKHVASISGNVGKIIELELDRITEEIENNFKTYFNYYKIYFSFDRWLIITFESGKDFDREKNALLNYILESFNNANIKDGKKVIQLADWEKVNKKGTSDKKTTTPKKNKKVTTDKTRSKKSTHKFITTEEEGDIEDAILGIELGGNKIDYVELKANKPTKDYQILTIKVKIIKS